MPRIRGLYELAIRVRDLARAEAFYRKTLGLEVGLRDDRRNWLFLRAGGHAGMVVLQQDAGPWPTQHLAFTVGEEDLDEAAAALRRSGVPVEGPVFHEWMPATSIYFSDPDGHDLELCAPVVKRAREPLEGAAASGRLTVSAMLAVTDAPKAVAWYEQALGADVLWSLGSVAGLEVQGAPFFVGEPERNGWESPEVLGTTSARVEVFCDDPDAFVARALQAGATIRSSGVRVHAMPWGPHRQGGFVDPFGHIWLVGDRSPLARFRR